MDLHDFFESDGRMREIKEMIKSGIEYGRLTSFQARKQFIIKNVKGIFIKCIIFI
jgi:hypothetical protein